jgi:hypothetical protein
MRELVGALVLGACVVVPLVSWRVRYGHWRVTRVADLVDGARVKVRGTVELLGRPLQAPFIDVHCVAYEIWREDPPRPDEAAWHTRGQDFLLREPGGDALLVRVDDRFDLHGGLSVAHYDDGFVDGRALVPGARAVVVGVAAREPAAEGEGASYREPPRRWTIAGTSTHPLVIVAQVAKGARRA